MIHGPYFFTIQRDPECPFCRQLLIPVATTFVDGAAFCHSCADVLGPLRIARILATQYDEATRAFWTNSRGLRFFTPHGFVPPKLAADLMASIQPENDRQSAFPFHEKPPGLRRTGIDEPHVPPPCATH